MKTLFRGRRLSLQTLLILISLAGVFGSLLITAMMMFYNTKTLVTEKLDVVHSTRFNQLSLDIERFFGDAQKIAFYLQSNSQLIDYIRTYESSAADPYAKNQIQSQIKRMLFTLKKHNEAVLSINIVTPGDQYYSGDMLFGSELVASLASRPADSMEFHYPETIFRNATLANQPRILRHLDGQAHYRIPLQDEAGVHGTIFILLKDELLRSAIADFDNLMIADEAGGLVYRGTNFPDAPPFPALQPAERFSVYPYRDYNIYGNLLHVHQWSLFYRVELSSYREQYELLRNLAVLSFAISIVVTFIFSRFISRRIAWPAARLTSIVRSYQVGDGPSIRFDRGIRKRDVSLREKIFYYLLVTIMLPICCFIGLFYVQSSAIISKQFTEAYQSIFSKTATNLSNFMEMKKSILLGLSYSVEMQDAFDRRAAGSEAILDMLEQYMFLGLDSDTFSLYDMSGRLLLSSQLRQPELLDKEADAALRSVTREVVWFMGKDRLNRDIVTLGMPVLSLTNGTGRGYATIEMEAARLTGTFAELNDSGMRTLLYNPAQGRPPFEAWPGPDSRAGTFEADADGAAHIVFYRYLPDSNWYLISLLDRSELVNQGKAVIMNNITMLIAVLFAVLLLSFAISWILLKPFKIMDYILDNFNLMHPERIPSNYFFIDEIYELGSNFNRMIGRIEDLIDELMMTNHKRHEIEMEKKTAELHALQAQIHPHFLQNTLDNTIYMIVENKKDQAVAMIKSLSSLFRYGISRDETMIPISEEWKYAKAYVQIMDIRYRGNIEFAWQIDEGLMSFKTLKLILQPLIENAIHHGVGDSGGAGRIRISCEDAGDRIRFAVSDNGKGMAEARLSAVREALRGEKPADSAGIGIHNVMSRIRLFFGPEYGVHIDSAPGEGTEAVIFVPKIADGPRVSE